MKWGPGALRRIASERSWDEPLNWDAKARRAGIRKRVFCASMADVFDNEVPHQWRRRLFDLIRQCGNLDFLLLTKRIGNATRLLPQAWLETPMQNVWLGSTIVNQEEAERDILKLLLTPAAVRFLSCEPLLGPIELTRMTVSLAGCVLHNFNCLSSKYGCGRTLHETIDWVIVGGESGSHARPFVLDYARSIVKQCHDAGIAVFVKQLGTSPVHANGSAYPVSDRKGAIVTEWPEELRVQEWPHVGSESVAT